MVSAGTRAAAVAGSKGAPAGVPPMSASSPGPQPPNGTLGGSVSPGAVTGGVGPMSVGNPSPNMAPNASVYNAFPRPQTEGSTGTNG